jgi:hypothetical protein
MSSLLAVKANAGDFSFTTPRSAAVFLRLLNQISFVSNSRGLVTNQEVSDALLSMVTRGRLSRRGSQHNEIHYSPYGVMRQ